MAPASASAQPTPELLEPPVLSGDPWASGGEARLWVDPTDSRFLIKVFCDPQSGQPRPRTGAAAQHLVGLATLSHHLLPSEWFELVEHFAWPVALYGATLDQIDAIRIPIAGSEYFFELESMYGRESMRLDLSYLITNHLESNFVVSSTAPVVSPADRAEVALSCARAMGVIWKQGLLYGDLSAKNVLWTATPRPRTFFLDVESCRPQGELGIFSPDWKPLDHLDGRVEGERSLFARLVWRIFAHSRNDAMPAVGVDEGDLAALGPAAKAALLECHQTGSSDSFERLLSALRSLRSPANEAGYFDWAVTSGFSRLVLENAPAQASMEQRQSLEAAERQADLERRLGARQSLVPVAVSEPGFNLDLPLRQLPLSSIDDHDDLRHLFETGEFQKIAEMFATGNSRIEINNTLTRAIRHALAEVGSPVVMSSRVPGSSNIRVSWSWPAVAWVNHCTIRQLDAHGGELSSVDCPRDGRSPMANVGPWPPSGGSLVITFAVGDGAGKLVEGDYQTGSVSTISVPARRIDPVAPTQSTTRPSISLPTAPIARANLVPSSAAAPNGAQIPGVAPPSAKFTPAATGKRRFWHRLFRRRTKHNS